MENIRREIVVIENVGPSVRVEKHFLAFSLCYLLAFLPHDAAMLARSWES